MTTSLPKTPAAVPAPQPCPTCRRKCECSGPREGCGHFDCWGQLATNDCPGIAYETARAQALSRTRARQKSSAPWTG